MKTESRQEFLDYLKSEFDETMLPGLKDFIKIKSSSRAFDPEWKTNGV